MSSSMDCVSSKDKETDPPKAPWWTAETVAVVTGANRGIGLALAERLAEQGLSVVLTARDEARGEAAAAALRSRGLRGAVRFRRLDVADPASVAAFAAWVRDELGGLDILVNNAGVSFNDIDTNSVEHAETVLRTNFFGAKMLTEALLPLFRRAPTTSRILNISSQLGLLNAIQLSTDHKPSHRNEIRRIQKAGGKLYLDRFVAVEVERVAGCRAFRGLCATSRSIGDFVFKQNKNLPPEEQMMICNPDIRSMEITDDVEFLIIASYGIWASMTCQAVVDFVHGELGSGETDLCVICAKLVHHVQPTRPDATAILIQFKRGAPDDDAEGSQDDSDGQEIKSEASDDQEIKSDASDEAQPFAPDRETISRALEFVRDKQRELMVQDIIRNTVQSSP